MGAGVALIASGWGDLARALAFHAGWWSAGAWIALVVSLAVTMTVAIWTRNDLLVGAMVLAGPIATVALFGTLKAYADPNPGCTYDCEGRLLLLGPCSGVLVGWAVGLVVGLVIASARRRREGGT